MILIKYRLTLENGFIEFRTYEEASIYSFDNDLSGNTEEVTEDISE